MPLVLETEKQGFEMFFKPWQVEAFKALWKTPEGANSKTVWDTVTETTRISRASIINFLNEMVDEEILTYTETTGKGGHYRIYKLELSETELKATIANRLIQKLLNEYPEATKNTINQMK